MEVLLDLAFDVEFDAVGVTRGELRHEMLRVRNRDDAPCDGEFIAECVFRGIVLNPEQTAEVETGLLHVIVVIL